MKKLFVVANLYHASPRIPGLTCHLSDLGWQVTILTPPLHCGADEALGFPEHFLSRVRIAGAPYKGDVMAIWRRLFQRLGYAGRGSLTEQVGESLGLGKHGLSLSNRLLIAYQTVFAFPDTERTWLRPALASAEELLRSERFDAVLSSSPFPTSHRVAYRLAMSHNLPWIADFRDPWTPNHAYPFPRLRKAVEEVFERRTLRPATAVIAAADAYALKIGRLHGREVQTITNGFDETTLTESEAPSSGPFTIRYTGTVYPGKQDPERLLRVLGRLVAGGRLDPSGLALEFYGLPSLNLESLIAAHGLVGVAHQKGRVSAEHTRQLQRQAHVLLLLNWEDRNERGVLPTKLFEYLAAQRPILATGGISGDDVERIIAATRAGVTAITDDEIEHTLLRWYDEYKLGRPLPYSGDRAAILSYSYDAGARKLSSILDASIH